MNEEKEFTPEEEFIEEQRRIIEKQINDLKVKLENAQAADQRQLAESIEFSIAELQKKLAELEKGIITEEKTEE